MPHQLGKPMKPAAASLCAALALLAACADRAEEGSGAAEAPAAGRSSAPPEILLGTWAADCERPEIRLEADRIHVFAEDATWPLTGAEATGERLVLRYDGPNGPVEETYAIGDGSLALVEGVYDGGAVTWNRPPMRQCPPA